MKHWTNTQTNYNLESTNNGSTQELPLEDCFTEVCTGVLNNLTASCYINNRTPKDIELLEESLETQKPLYAKNPECFAENYASALNNLATAYSDFNRIPEAITLFEESLAIRKALYVKNKDFFAKNSEYSHFGTPPF